MLKVFDLLIRSFWLPLLSKMDAIDDAFCRTGCFRSSWFAFAFWLLCLKSVWPSSTILRMTRADSFLLSGSLPTGAFRLTVPGMLVYWLELLAVINVLDWLFSTKLKRLAPLTPPLFGSTTLNSLMFVRSTVPTWLFNFGMDTFDPAIWLFPTFSCEVWKWDPLPFGPSFLGWCNLWCDRCFLML